MSEYQYYEFRAVDRPLSSTERRELRALSTRARITATSFTNDYQWGDFKGDPDLLMERYFDLFLYFANWGSRRFSMRLPAPLADDDLLRTFFVDDAVARFRVAGDWLIVDIFRDEVAVDYWDNWEEDSGCLADLTPLRDDVLTGDLRVFYLMWLMAVESGEVDDDAVEPLPGIAPLTASLEAFADFFDIDPDLVVAAASADPATAGDGPAGAGVADGIRALSEDEKVAFLVRLHDGNSRHLGPELRRRLHAKASVPVGPSGKRRTVAELLELARGLAAERRRAAEERAEKERRRKEREEAAERKRRLEAVAKRGEVAWRDVETLIGQRNPQGYERAVALLADLRELARAARSLDDFGRRLADISNRHAAKGRFLERLTAAALR